MRLAINEGLAIAMDRDGHLPFDGQRKKECCTFGTPAQWAAFQAFLALYELTHEPRYLDWAEHAMEPPMRALLARVARVLVLLLAGALSLTAWNVATVARSASEARAVEGQLAELRARRDNGKVAELRARLESAAHGTENLLPLFVECVEHDLTLGEICNLLRGLWGEYQPTTTL